MNIVKLVVKSVKFECLKEKNPKVFGQKYFRENSELEIDIYTKREQLDGTEDIFFLDTCQGS